MECCSSPISFWTPIHFGNQPKTCSQFLLEYVDHYFSSFDDERADVILGHAVNGKEAVTFSKGNPSYVMTVLKIISLFTLILPAILMIAKIILRSIHTFYPKLSELSNAKIDKLFPHVLEEYLEDSRCGFDKIPSIEIVAAFQAGKYIGPVLSNRQVQNLKLSELSNGQIEHLFPDYSDETHEDSMQRFALIPDQEVHAALRAGKLIKPLLSVSQLQNLKLSMLSDKQIEKLFPIYDEKLYEESIKRFSFIPDPEVVAALKAGKLIKRLLSVNQLKNFKLSELSNDQIHQLFPTYFPYSDTISIDSKEQFARISDEEIEAALKANKAIVHLMSAEQLEKYLPKAPSEVPQ